MNTLTCKLCKQTKPSIEFRPRSKTCRKCYNIQASSYWEENRESLREYQQEQYRRWKYLVDDLNELIDFTVEKFDPGSYKHQVIKSYVMTYGVAKGVSKVIQTFVERHFPEGINRKKIPETLEQLKRNWKGLPGKFKKADEQRFGKFR